MEQIQYSNRKRSTQLLSWFLPTIAECAIYLFLTFLTVIALNADFLRNSFLIPQDFSIQNALLGSLEKSLTELVGSQLSATIVTAGFWALVGIIVYTVLVVFGNFSREVRNDLVITGYMHPRGDDTYYPLKRLVLRIVFHIGMTFLLVMYFNFFIGQLVPFLSDSLVDLSFDWSDITFIYQLAVVVLIELFALHIFVVLIRLLLLKKRVFGPA